MKTKVKISRALFLVGDSKKTTTSLYNTIIPTGAEQQGLGSVFQVFQAAPAPAAVFEAGERWRRVLESPPLMRTTLNVQTSLGKQVLPPLSLFERVPERVLERVWWEVGACVIV